MLNSYFVPVYTRNEEFYGPHAKPDPKEAAERQRIYHDSLRSGNGGGDVWVYLLTPDAKIMPGVGKHRAVSKANPFAEALQEVINHLGTKPGEPIVKPRAQSRPKESVPNGLTIHLTARGIWEGSWREFPAENWIVLKPEEWRKLLPPAGDIKAGTTWEVDPELAKKILTNFYPATEDTVNYHDRNRFESHYIRGRVLSVEGGKVRARLDSKLRMNRSFYPNGKDDRLIEATSVGFVEFRPDRSFIDALEMATKSAHYGDEDFAVGLRTNYEGPKY
jgi:hypothetical protein